MFHGIVFFKRLALNLCQTLNGRSQRITLNAMGLTHTNNSTQEICSRDIIRVQLKFVNEQLLVVDIFSDNPGNQCSPI